MPTDEKSIPTHQSVSAEVADFLGNASSDVRGKLIEVLTGREVQKRVDILDKALVKRKELQKEVEKIRPKKVFTADGTEAPGTFTAEEFQNLKKSKEKLVNFETQLEKAFQGDAQAFEKLGQQLSGKPDPEQP